MNAAPSPRALRRTLRRMRRASTAARPIGEVLQDLYIMLFGIALVAVTVAPLAQDALTDVAGRAGSQHAPHGLTLALAAALALAALGVGLRALVMLGPVVRDPADATWLLAAPVDRRGLLRPSALLLFLAAGLCGAGTGLAVALLAVAPRWVGAVGGACAGFAVAALALSAQGTAHGRVLRRASDVVTVLAVPLLIAGLAGALPSLRPVAANRLAVVTALVLLVAVIALVPAAHRTLHRLRRADLVAGAGLALGLRATVTALDGSFIAETLRARRLVERGTVAVKPLRGKGASALVAADVRRAVRWPRGPLLALAAAPLTWAADDLYGRVGAVAVLALTAWGAAAATSGGLRAVTRSRALARAFPLSDSALREAHVIVPTFWSLIVAIAATALAGRPLWWAPVAALVAAAASLRTAAGRPPTRWEVQSTSPMGALPVGAVTALLVGPDVVVLTSLPWLVGAGPTLSAALPLLAMSILLRWNRRAS